MNPQNSNDTPDAGSTATLPLSLEWLFFSSIMKRDHGFRTRLSDGSIVVIHAAALGDNAYRLGFTPETADDRQGVHSLAVAGTADTGFFLGRKESGRWTCIVPKSALFDAEHSQLCLMVIRKADAAPAGTWVLRLHLATDFGGAALAAGGVDKPPAAQPVEITYDGRLLRLYPHGNGWMRGECTGHGLPVGAHELVGVPTGRTPERLAAFVTPDAVFIAAPRTDLSAGTEFELA